MAGTFLVVGYACFENKSGGTSKIIFYDIANIGSPVLDDFWFVGMHENWADLYHLNLGISGPVVTKKYSNHFSQYLK